MSAGRTEIMMVTGQPILVEGDVRAVESAVLAAARGSIMELVWFNESGTGHEIGVNPDHVVALRSVAREPGG